MTEERLAAFRLSRESNRRANPCHDFVTGYQKGGAMGESQRAFEQALHESTAIADRIREVIADAPPKPVMLALTDLLQEHLTHLVMVEQDREQTPLPKVRS